MDYLNKLDEDMESQQERQPAGSFHNNGDDLGQPSGYMNSPNGQPNSYSSSAPNNNSKNPLKAILIAVVIGILGFILVMIGLTAFIFGPQIDRKVKEQIQEDTGVASTELDIVNEETDQKLKEIQDLINQYYLDKPDEKKVKDAIYKGLVRGLEDPYSEYFTEEEVKQWNESTSGSYSGIGAVLQKDLNTNLPEISRVFEGSPAEEAGLKKGDRLFKVDDQELTGMDLQLAVTFVKGEEGSVVKLSVLREGEKEPLEISVTRRKIEVPTVNSKILEGDKKIGYIEITQFEMVTAVQFEEALLALKDKGAEALIVDLRDNPGGLLDSVVTILDNFFEPNQLLVYMQDKYGNREDFISRTKTVWEKEVVVLVNKNSASASEIFAGAMKDTDRGILIGETTFGKGVVQRFIDLPDNTAVKLTIASYFTPSGYDLHGKGVEVDEVIEAKDISEEAKGSSQEDTYIKKAIELLNK